MKKIIPLLFFFSLLSASMLYKNKNICIEDFYYKNGYFYYKKSSDSKWYRTWNTDNNIEYGYFYNDDNNTCKYNLTLKELKISYFDFSFLWGLSGLLMGAIFLFGLVAVFAR